MSQISKKFKKLTDPNKEIIIFFALIFFYTVSLFIAPLTLEPGTVKDLDGNANMIDYSGKWSEMNPYHRAIYLFSDFNCHQKHYRSYFINDNQMPVCARDVGIFIGMSVGFLMMAFVRRKANFKDVLLFFIPKIEQISEKKKTLAIIGFGALFVLPMAFDGGIQLVSSYESTNPARIITGLLFGFGFSAFISSIFISSIAEVSGDLYEP
ncbi:MAG: DUF2085 domain-containing protein [Thermoplasmatota archaeon]